MKTKVISRIGAVLFDNIALYALGLGALIQLGYLAERALILASIGFVLYSVLTPTFCKGYQLGKYLLGMKIVTDTYDQPSVWRFIVRELSKIMYTLPIIGIILILTSQFLMTRREDGKTLHDLIAGTRVIRI